MASIIAGIGEFGFSNNPEVVIQTFALGSCVALMAYDKTKRIAGLVHIALPESSISLEKAAILPGYFADTAIAYFFKELYRLGASRNNTFLKMAGGARVLNSSDKFDIGKRNVLAIKKILWKEQLGVIAEDVGGEKARTIHFYVASGEIVITSGQNKWQI